MQSSAVDTITNPVVELDDAGDNVIIRGTTTDETTSEETNVEESIRVSSSSRVQLRGESDGFQLLKINVEDDVVNFTPSADSGGEGEAFIAASSSDVVAPAAVQAFDTSSTLTVGGTQAEGESVAAAATTLADVFVPATNDGSSRTDATVLALDEGDVWIGQPAEAPNTGVNPGESADSALENLAAELSVHSSEGDKIAENQANETLDELAIDAILSNEL